MTRRRLAIVFRLGLGLVATRPATAGAADLFDDVERVAAELKATEPARRREAVDRLDAYRPDEVRPYLYDALHDGDAEVRVRAALSIGRHQLSDAADRLVTLLGDPEPRLRAAAATALGQVPLGEAATGERAARALERALGDAEHEVRQAAVGAIGRLPPSLQRGVAVAVAGRLDDDHPGVRQKAAEVLARLGDPRAVIPLVGRLGDGSREVRAAALEALGQLGDQRAAPAMIRLLGDVADEVRAEAVQSLGRLHARAAVVPLINLVERGAEPLRGRAAVALGQIASAPPPELESDPAIAALVRALGTSELRQAAREALRVAGAPAVPSLCARLPAASGEELVAIVDLLGELRDARASQPLLAELGRARIGRERVVDALGAMARAGDTRLTVELVALLDDRDVAVRRRAAHALAGVVDARASSALGAAVTDSDRDVRLAVIGELGRLRAARALPRLVDALASSDEDTAAAAARALGEIGDRRAALPLTTALDRKERRVRRDAADALSRLADVASLPAILYRARSAEPERRLEAIAALGGQLRGRGDAVARELLLGYAEGADAVVAEEALDALAAMHDPETLPRLSRLLPRADVAVRRRVVQALGALGDVAPSQLLVTRLESDADARVRAEAAWALGKRTPGPFVDALATALASPYAPVRANAAAALARLGRAPEGLLRLVHDVDSATRGNAALALGRVAAAAPSLRQLAAGDPDARTRDAARRALGGERPGARSDWIGFYLVDFDGAPLGDARYRLLLPDGLIKLGQADARGVVREESLPKGACELDLVDDSGAR